MKLSSYSNQYYSHFSLYLAFVLSFLELVHSYVIGSYLWIAIGMSLLISILLHSSNINNRKPYLNKNLFNRILLKIFVFITSSILLKSAITFMIILLTLIDKYYQINMLLPVVFVSLILGGTFLGFYSRSTKL